MTSPLTAHLLSSDHLPRGLADRLVLQPARARVVVVWRFEGSWQHQYTGEVGEQSERHTINQREVLDADGNVAHVADGTTAKVSMRWRPADGELRDDFDVVIAEGDIPDPPGPRWFAEAARVAVAADGVVHTGPEPVAWEAGGMVVDDEAGLALRRHLGSPHLSRLQLDSTHTVRRTTRASVTFLEICGTFDGEPVRFLVGPGPEGAVWGRAPSDPARKEELSSGSAAVLIAGAVWALLSLVGLLAFVLPGLIAAAIGFVHVRSLIRRRDARIEQWRDEERPALTRALEHTLSAE